MAEQTPTELVAELRARHQPHRGEGCLYCRPDDWPCDVELACRAIETLQQACTRALEALRDMGGGASGSFVSSAPREPEIAIKVLRDALAKLSAEKGDAE